MNEEILSPLHRDLLDLPKDRDLRSPIAPPVTSKGAMVISSAGTSKEKELVISDVRHKQSDTHARELSETLLREHQGSAHTDTNTNALLHEIAALKEQLNKVNAEKEMFKAQVDRLSSTSVQNQLAILRNDVQELRSLTILKTNSLHHSNTLATEDLANNVSEI